MAPRSYAKTKRTLVARRKKGPVDRLLKRISDMAQEGQIEFVEAGIPFYRLVGSSNDYQVLQGSQLNSCVRAISPIPRLNSRLNTGRESMIYTPERLKAVVETLFGVVSAVAERDLRQILEVLLTPWAPVSLVPVEKEYVSSGNNAEDSIEEEQMITSARSLANSLSRDQRVILVLKSQNVADTLVASEVGVSRPTVADMKKSVLVRVGQELIADLPANRHERAMQYLLEECNSLIEEESQ